MNTIIHIRNFAQLTKYVMFLFLTFDACYFVLVAVCRLRGLSLKRISLWKAITFLCCHGLRICIGFVSDPFFCILILIVALVCTLTIVLFTAYNAPVWDILLLHKLLNVTKFNFWFWFTVSGERRWVEGGIPSHKEPQQICNCANIRGTWKVGLNILRALK